MLRKLALSATTAASLLSSTAHADDALRAREEVRVVMGRGTAKLVVRHVARNHGLATVVLNASQDLPESAVAVGLRVTGKGIVGDLLDAELASTRFSDFISPGKGPVRAAALVSWGGPSAVNVSLFPVPPGGERAVEVEVAVATEYQDGRERLVLPPLSEHRTLVGVSAEHVADAVSFHHGKDGDVVTLRRASPPPLAGLLHVAPAATTSAVRLRVAAAPRLGEIPEDARVVVLLDASKSMLPGDVAAMRALAAETLPWFKGGKAAVLAFDREVRELTQGFQPVDEAAVTVQKGPLALHHGSRLDRALARAKEMLAREPSTSPQRVILFSDLLGGSVVNEERAAKAFEGTQAILHVVTPREGRASLFRRDGAWDPWVRRTGGLVWTASADPAAGDATRALTEELVRPKRILDLQLRVSNAKLDAVLADELAEGGASELSELTTTPPSGATVSGLVWGKRVGATLVPDEKMTRTWAALATVSLPVADADLRSLALRGHAVTSVTSLLAAEEGAGPSVDGVLVSTGSLGLNGVGTGGRDGGFGHLGPRHDAFDPSRLRREAEARYRGCGGKGGAKTEIEVTLAEIVDVRLTAGPTDGAGVEPCYVEGMWQSELGTFRGPVERRLTFVLEP